METLYHHTNNLLQETHNCLSRLEKSHGDDAASLEREIQARIDSITSNCEKLDIFVHKEPFARRQTSKTRVDQLKYDNQHLQAGLRSLQHKRYKKELEYTEREELLNRRFTSNSEKETSIQIDYAGQHHNSLQNANKGMDELIYSGSSILDNLKDQRITLKGAQRRLIDIGNSLGLSNTTMRLIEQRASQDKWILFGGMAVTLTIIILIIIYVK